MYNKTCSQRWLLVDEISTASPLMQVKLLRFLQSMEYEPVGSSLTIQSTARVILATNEALEKMVAEGRFREDLYYRVNVINICMPPLRERQPDIEILANAMLVEANSCLGKRIELIDKDALEQLRQHPWPGNIRELKNVIERGVLLADGSTLTPESLSIPQRNRRLPTEEMRARGTLKEAMKEPERGFIRDALVRYRGNRGATAEALGINRTTLYKKMKRLGLESGTFTAFSG